MKRLALNLASQHLTNQISTVWNKGHIVEGYDPNYLRLDDFKNPMKRDEYGNRESDFGWEIDHIIPKAKGGSDDLNNLRPLQWNTNVKRPHQTLY